MTYFYTWMQSNILEWFIYLPALCYFAKKANVKNTKNSWQFITVCNAITHPIVFFAFMASPLNFKWSILSAESFAILAEALLIYFFYTVRADFWKILAVSFLANLVSWQVAPYCTYAVVQLLSFVRS